MNVAVPSSAEPSAREGAEGALTALRSARGSLSGALRRIADVLLADPAAGVELSIAQLAEAAEASPASVVRLARDLGHSGYRELRAALRTDLAYAHGREAGETEREEFLHLNRDIDPDDPLEQVVAKIAYADALAVTETARRLDLDALARAADLVAGAHRIAVLGVGASGIAAADLQQKLARIGLWAAAYGSAHDGLPAAALLAPGDVAVGISHGGDTLDVLDALRIAREGGAATIAVTDAPDSPIVEGCDIPLLTSAQESPFRSGATASRLAQLTLVDILFVAVAQRRHGDAVDALARTRRAVADRRRGRRGGTAS
ncbi:MurR/RpiR family transcriptional regulator [Brachybacterium sp. DNPG3]